MRHIEWDNVLNRNFRRRAFFRKGRRANQDRLIFIQRRSQPVVLRREDQRINRTATVLEREGCPWLPFPIAAALNPAHHAANCDFSAFLDLGLKTDPQVHETFKFYDFTRDSTRHYANAVAEYLDAVAHDAVMHVGSHVAFTNASPTAAQKKILIFGDSYASQRTDALTAMLAESAREVEFVWSSNLDWRFIERSKPDILIYEMVERFMTVLPKDNLSLHWVVATQGLRAKWLKYRAERRAASGAKHV